MSKDLACTCMKKVNDIVKCYNNTFSEFIIESVGEYKRKPLLEADILKFNVNNGRFNII